MNYNMGLNHYLETSVNTAFPAELTLMLQNALVKHLTKARDSISQNQVQRSHESILRSQDILREFQATLDMKYPISQNLMLLYDYMKRRLIEANIKKDMEAIEEVLGFARELRDSWAIAIKKSPA